jgi:hypothetical protein
LERAGEAARTFSGRNPHKTGGFRCASCPISAACTYAPIDLRVITPLIAPSCFFRLAFRQARRFPLPMTETLPVSHSDETAHSVSVVGSAGTAALSAAGQAALAQAAALAKKASAPATLRAYKSDWTHYAAWCGAMGFVPVPAAPATVGAYLASLGDKAPTTIRRRLAR